MVGSFIPKIQVTQKNLSARYPLCWVNRFILKVVSNHLESVRIKNGIPTREDVIALEYANC